MELKGLRETWISSQSHCNFHTNSFILHCFVVWYIIKCYSHILLLIYNKTITDFRLHTPSNGSASPSIYLVGKSHRRGSALCLHDLWRKSDIINVWFISASWWFVLRQHDIRIIAVKRGVGAEKCWRGQQYSRNAKCNTADCCRQGEFCCSIYLFTHFPTINIFSFFWIFV